MQSKQRSRPDLLECLFENRNKEYGAYPLRREYSKRLKKSLVITFGLCGGFLLYLSLLSEKVPGSSPDLPKEPVTMIELKPPDIGKNTNGKLQGFKSKNPNSGKVIEEKVPVIVKNEIESRLSETVSMPVQMDEMISTMVLPGDPGYLSVEVDKTTFENGQSEGIDSAEFIFHSDGQVDEPAAFPGGMEALQKFIQRQIQFSAVPDKEEIYHVRVKFVIDKEGNANRFEPV